MTSSSETTSAARRATAVPLERLAAVGIGGAVGSGVRYGAVSLDRSPSLTILVVNVVGSALLGALIAHRSRRGAHGLEDRWTALVGIGFCGGLTTFSTHVVDVADRIADGGWANGSLSLVATTVLCVAAAMTGHRLLDALDDTAAS